MDFVLSDLAPKYRETETMIEQNSNKQAAKNLAKTNKKVENGGIKQPPREIGGIQGVLDPTRYGDWEKQGRCIDF